VNKPTAILLLLFTLAGTAFSNIFYVSSSGSDDNPGLSKDKPLKTLAKAAEKVAPGDKILLRHGDVFRESVAVKTKNIELNAYGPADEDLPAVSGSVEITGWQPYKDKIYVAKADADLGYLFVNGKMMTIARYPNAGWLRTKYWQDKRLSRRADPNQLRQANTIITCPELAEHPRNADGYWLGANIRWRHHSWWYETRTVIGYDSGGRLSLDDRSFAIEGPFDWDKKGWGFYLDNKLDQLDVPGEWYFDRDTKKVYFYAPDGANPNMLLVEGSSLSEGLSVTDATVKNICFRHQKDIGLEIDGTSVVRHCRFEGIGRDAKVSERGAGGAALRVARSARNVRISHNTFRNNFNLAITFQQDRDADGSSIIERNVIENTGMVPGYGGSGSWHAVAIRIATGKNVHVRYNRIENTGYVGILFGTEGNFAEYNIIKNAMATLNDGGGIYTNCSRSTIRHNIILDTKGGMESSGTWANISHAIWPEFLREFKENIIEYNTCAGSGGDGIFLPNNFDCIIRNNVCYNNERYQLLLTGRGQQQNANPNQNHIITGNVLYAAKPTQNALYFDPRNDYGTLKDNYFCKPSAAELIHEGKSWPGTSKITPYTLDAWQEKYPWADKSAKTDIQKISLDPNQPNPADSSQLFINDTEQTKTIPLEGTWRDLDGNTVAKSITLEPYTSRILIRTKPEN